GEDPATQQRTAEPNPLFPEDELHNFRARWDQVQTSFVDEPRQAVEQADSLVANVVKRIAEQFSTERAKSGRPMGSGRQRLHRGSTASAQALPLVLRSATHVLIEQRTNRLRAARSGSVIA